MYQLRLLSMRTDCVLFYFLLIRSPCDRATPANISVNLDEEDKFYLLHQGE
jgi:hypothetical protein